MGLLSDLLSAIDARKRVLASNLRDPVGAMGLLGGALSDERRRSKRETEEAARRVMGGGGLLGLSVMPGVDSVTDMPEWEAAGLAPMGLLGAIKAPRDAAMKAAQKNATKLLGLPPNNTAADRAKAMGYTKQGWRGSSADESEAKGARWWSEDRDYANLYGEALERPIPEHYAGNVMPLRVNMGNAKPFTKVSVGGVPDHYAMRVGEDGLDTGYRLYQDGRVYEGLTVPQNVRSVFAAFDPAKRGSSDLLATLAGLGLLTPLLMSGEDAGF